MMPPSTTTPSRLTSRTAWILLLLLSSAKCRANQQSPWRPSPDSRPNNDILNAKTPPHHVYRDNHDKNEKNYNKHNAFREKPKEKSNKHKRKKIPRSRPFVKRPHTRKRSVYRLLRALQPKKSSQLEPTPSNRPLGKSKNQMYLTCFAIIFSWFTLGTLFYSKFNHWPLPQSFFYAVDAGMSIGFCTQVAETKIGSRAFTIVYILLGASFIGGALAYTVQHIIEGAVSRSSALYRHILEEDALKKRFFEGRKIMRSGNGGMMEEGTLSHEEFRLVLEEIGCELSDEAFSAVCEIYDPDRRGYVDYEHFSKIYQGIDRILPRKTGLARRLWDGLRTVFNEENRIFLWFVSWVGLGVMYGMKSQKWDFITATHFAVSALATGGLTAPPVDENGILPTEPAIFCGLYCIFGVPLFAMTLGQFASVLIEGYLVEEEHAAIIRPLSESEYEFASKSLCTKDDAVHLSDFIVLQLMRQGKMSVESLQFMKRQFELCDKDKSGKLSWREATQLTENIR
mmetsp:Transcript_14677/g.30032  ORF Transcript_14677/g.30032 Transcript_14677/m.30032 type:complete len:511 (-) Transcript_14677:41-1573(-)